MKEPFWERVQSLQKAHKISLDNLAEYVGVLPNTLKGWIYKDRIPNAYCSCDIADALGVTVEYLVRGRNGAAEELRMQQVEERKTASTRITKLALELGDAAKQLQ